MWVGPGRESWGCDFPPHRDLSFKPGLAAALSTGRGDRAVLAALCRAPGFQAAGVLKVGPAREDGCLLTEPGAPQGEGGHHPVRTAPSPGSVLGVTCWLGLLFPLMSTFPCSCPWV